MKDIGMYAGILGLVLLAFVMLPARLSADICSYVDARGVRHFSNGADCPADSASVSKELESGDRQADQNRQGLRFMGVYKDGADYLRFYGDGTVVSGQTAARPHQLAPWFGKSNKNLSKGQYSVDSEDTIRFYCSSEQRAVLYKGTISDNELIVQLLEVDQRRERSEQVRLRGYRKYRFIPLDFPRDNLY